MPKTLEGALSVVAIGLIYSFVVWVGWDILALPIRGLPLINPLQAIAVVLLVTFLTDLVSGVVDR